MWWELKRRWILWGYARAIKKYGWTATYVHGRSGENFTYSLGFSLKDDQPEVIFFGFPPEAANGVLWAAYNQFILGPARMEDQAIWSTVWEGFPPVVWREVHPTQIRREYFNLAIIFREKHGLSREGLRAFQLVMPDRNGKYSWEEGFDLEYRPRQPELHLPYFGPPEED